jgi:transcription antitermination factor NusG
MEHLRMNEAKEKKKQWYCVEAYASFEQNVYLRLANAGLEIWRAIDVQRPSARRSNSKRLEPIRPKRLSRFGSFLFVRVNMTDSMFDALRNTTNVRRVICYAGSTNPCPISDELIEFYKQPRTKEKNYFFRLNDKVKILDGPLANNEAIIKSIAKNHVCELELITSSYNSTRIIIDSSNIAAL